MTKPVDPNQARGIWRSKRKTNPWRAAIQIDYRRVSLGAFKTPEEASAAYEKARKRYGR